MLVVTFTNAAASEMKERVSKRLYEESLTKPYLREQLSLLPKASITTIDSFCNRVVKDNFFKFNLNPNYRIGEQSELELLKLESLEELFEEKYELEDEDFANIINLYGSNKDDENLRSLILKIYNFTRSCVDPEKWLLDKLEVFAPQSNTSLITNSYAQYVLEYAKKQIENAINELQSLSDELTISGIADKYVEVIEKDVDNLKILSSKTFNWDELYNALNDFEFARASGSKGVPEEIVEEIKNIRESVKKTVKENLRDKYFVSNSKEIIEDYKYLYNNLKIIIDLVLDFSERFGLKKYERGILDFSDISHYTLKLFNEHPEVKKMYLDSFEEIMIDEYQDSNMIQECILSSISNNRMFMVGDVKQSIYRFRQARPEIFLKKYNTFENYDGQKVENESFKIQLYKNFRSSKNVIDQVNFVFENIMSKEVGEIEYNDDEALILGADYYNDEKEKAELTLIETSLPDDIDIDDELLYDTNANIEGKYIAKRILELVGNYEVYDKNLKTYRKAKYSDVAILLRSTVNKVDGISEELSNCGIPVYSDVGGEYFENTEVQTILSLLRIIDNSTQDIPLVAVLRSQIGGFSVEELSNIRLCDRKSSFYDAMLKSLNLENELSKKVSNFLDKLNSWKERSKYLSLWELLWAIYNETGYYYYVSLFPDGLKRQSNLKLLLERAEKYEKTSFKGLFNFLNYIDNIKSSSTDFGESKLIGENENVVRLMSVHKSKGLEFPIVFLAGVEKRFNVREYSEDIILDQDFGFGMDVIDRDARIKYPHISKHAVTLKSKENSISEEMRILYVALTRCRQKLIVTGLVKDAQKAIIKYSSKLTKYKILNSSSFLDWLGYSIIDKTNLWDVKTISRMETSSLNSTDEIIKKDNTIDKDTNCFEDINSQMKWIYSYEADTMLPNKVSISELKRQHSKEPEEDISININKEVLIKTPDFMNKNVESGTKFGTLMHTVLQKIDFKEFNKEQLEKIVTVYIDDEIVKRAITNRILKFSNSSLFKELQNAKGIYKETSFNLNIPAKEIYNVSSEASIMVQGIIDLYFFNDKDELILVDYKTDNVESEEELIKRYKIQLTLYKRALEEILGKKVSKTIIYSFKLEKEILL